MPKMKLLWIVFSLSLALLLPAGAAGQTFTGSISGTVVDASGSVVAGAAISLINEATGEKRRATANESGGFVFALVRPGSYTIKVERAGFRGYERTGVALPVNERLALGDIELTVGEVSETVTTRAEGALVQTETAETSALLTPKQLEQMIVKGRDVIHLIRLLPGVTQGNFNPQGGEVSETESRFGSQALGGAFGTVVPTISGSRASWNTVSLDGQSGNDADVAGAFNGATSVDAIAEVKVVLNSYQAEYGRNSGPQITIVSKSGGRDFHGSLYYFKRHETFNANDFFRNRSGLGKPIFRYNTGGGTVSGPVYIPRVFNQNREKLFFFVSREDWRIRQPINNLTRITVPTALEREGNFSQTFDQAGRLIAIRDPLTGQPFAGNVIPQGRLNSNGQALLKLFPLPNVTDRAVTGGAYNYEWQEIQEVPKFTGLLKIDYLPTSRDTVSLRGRNYNSDLRGFQGLAAFNSNWPQLRHRYLFTEDSVAVAYTHVFNQTLVNEFNAGFRDLGERGFPRAANTFDAVTRAKVGFTLAQFNPQVNPLGLVPAASFGGVPSAVNIAIDGRTPINAGDQRLHLSDNIGWERGSHSLKFGVYFERNWTAEGPRSNNFSGSFSFGRDPNNPLDANWAFANAALGVFQSYQEPDARTVNQGQNYLLEWFAQDTWKATRKLTLNYGVRFSSYTPWQYRDFPGAIFIPDRYDAAKAPALYRPAFDQNRRRVGQDPRTGAFVPQALIGGFVPGSGDPTTGMVVSTDASFPNGFIEREPVQVAPRAGFAWNVFGDGKTALRGGFGISKQAMAAVGSYLVTSMQSPPIVFTPQIFWGSFDTLAQARGVNFPQNVSARDLDPVTPSVYNFSLGIQREIGLHTVLDVSYVGNVGRHLIQQRNINQVPYGARFLAANADPTNPARSLPDNFLRPFPGYGNINYIENSGASNYHGLHVAANRRFASSVQFGAAYTWSKAMGVSTNDAETLAAYRPWRVWHYGKLGFDQTHKLVFNYIWDLPRPSRLVPHALVRRLFDDWQLSGITTFSSGLPSDINLTTTDNADLTGGGDGARVVIIGDPALGRGERSFDRWFNTSAFARPARGDFGNAPMDVFRGPGIHNWDLTLFKRIPLGKNEARRLQLRWEVYNVFNHTQYFGVDTTARFDPAGRQVNARFGQVTSARLPRVMQLALHFYF